MSSRQDKKKIFNKTVRSITFKMMMKKNKDNKKLKLKNNQNSQKICPKRNKRQPR